VISKSAKKLDLQIYATPIYLVRYTQHSGQLFKLFACSYLKECYIGQKVVQLNVFPTCELFYEHGWTGEKNTCGNKEKLLSFTD